MYQLSHEEWEKQYNKDIDELIRANAVARLIGEYVAFSGPAILTGSIDPDLPYGVIRNGNGTLYDVLLPDERAKNPLPDGYHPGKMRAVVIKD